MLLDHYAYVDYWRNYCHPMPARIPSETAAFDAQERDTIAFSLR